MSAVKELLFKSACFFIATGGVLLFLSVMVPEVPRNPVYGIVITPKKTGAILSEVPGET